MIELRDYQRAARASLEAAHRGGARRVLLVAPTGAGKTTIGADLVAGAVGKASPTLFLAHRTELIDQASERLNLFGLPHGIIKAGRPADPGALIQIASVQSLARRTLPPARVVIVDEAHRTLGASYVRILEAYPDAVVIGLTATPIRLDGRGLGDVYERLIEAATIGELVARGVLHRPRVFAPTAPDLAGIATTAGDFNQLQLAEAMDKPQLVGDVVATWQRLADGMRTVAFASSVAHSLSIRDAFRAAGVAAEHVDGATPAVERKAILDGLAAGTVTVVSNFGVLTEGWDCPPCAVCILARPTKSLGLYLQMVGRVLRTHPGKPGAIVLDHAGATLMHGLATQPREWTLDAARRRSKAEAAPAVRQCSACYAIAEAGPAACPECGASYPRIVRVAAGGLQVRSGELRELTEDQIELRQQPQKGPLAWRRAYPAAAVPSAAIDDQAELYRALKGHGVARGYKAQWPAWMFKEVTRAYPTKAVRDAARLDPVP